MEQHEITGNLLPLISVGIICLAIFVTAFSLTFFRKADTSDKKH
ncbi:hypothetical protein [Pedobacter insulae]|uniref:Uncharacterized protein n=1 Tax=Pedobacter insulae TaxID=414048 RepID=A0A1I2XVH7_9SPHI|nr:hypothetical protein [Pedobacter insulae]SFH17450.1 hypothetical protein SAMN04489864_10665 [Pedobacter insulae]